MAEVFRPGSTAELSELVADAHANARSLAIQGGGSRAGFGRPVAADAVLDLASFAGVSLYEPEELVLTAGAATPMAEIEALLAQRGQRLAFEPPDLGPLWGQEAGRGTLGGMLSVGLGGSRRLVAGAPRDHFLGFKAVNGFGEAFAAGGRVVKNVTGYDLPKLMAGAFGTLGVMTEVTVKVLPRPETVQTLVAFGLEDVPALTVLREALGGPLPITGAAHLPLSIAARLRGTAVDGELRAVTLIRLESIPSSVAAAVVTLLARLSAASAEIAEMSEAESDALWRAVGAGGPFADGSSPVWRLSIPPASATMVGEELRRAHVTRFYYDWAGAALWLEGPRAEDAGAATVRAIVREAGGGHATLVRGSPELRARVSPFEPLAPPLAALTRRVKQQFDPAGVFNPGRMYEGV